MKIKFLLAPALAGFVLVSTLRAGSFAAAIVNYNPGTGYTAGYTNAAVVLGQPSTGTATHPVTPFAPPSRTNQILSLGAGGSLTVSFDPPIVNVPGNPFGLNFLIFGNSFFVENSNSAATGAVFANPCQARVSVSSDGVRFYQLNPSLAPPLNYLYPTDSPGNFQIPVNPALTDFTNLTLPQIRALYNGSAGGAGYAISWAQDTNGSGVSLFEIRYIRIDVQSGQALVAGFSAVSNANQVIAEDFSRDPAQDGWQYFGDTNLFAWNQTNQNLQVTWDSSQPNSYFHHPLGTILGTNDDFSFSFDLYLTDYAAGLTADNSFSFEIAAGLQNFAEASLPGFLVGTGADAPDLAEFDFFPSASGLPASVDPTFIDSKNVFSSNAYGYVALPTGLVMRVSLNYTASNETGTLTITTNGAPVTPPLSLNLTVPNLYEPGPLGDYHLDTFAVESYSGAESGSSVLAHGAVGNVLLVVPPPPVTGLQAAVVNGKGQVQFASRPRWNYVLQSSTDLQTWRPVASPVAGTGGNLILQDTSSLQLHQFYRVNALRAD